MNIAVQAILKMITNVSLFQEDATFDDMSAICGMTFLEALDCDPIACGHAVVQACHASGQHHKQLHQLITEGNTNKTFGPSDAPVEVPDVALLWDIDTRWDSVYLMICHLRVLHPVRVCVISGKYPS